MKKIFITLMAVLAMVTFTASANANKLYSEFYGNWELMAWSRNNHFCALKTYIGDKTFAIRKTSYSLTLVITDPNVRFNTGTANIDVSFDGTYWGSGTEKTYRQWRDQVFVEVDPSSANDFLNHVIQANVIRLTSTDVDYNLTLSGTEVLGGKLDECVRVYNF